MTLSTVSKFNYKFNHHLVLLDYKISPYDEMIKIWRSKNWASICLSYLLRSKVAIKVIKNTVWFDDLK